MPRGVYDRSKSKAKRAAVSTGATPAAIEAKPAKKWTRKTKILPGNPESISFSGTASGRAGTSVTELYTHLGQLTQTRAALTSPSASHNEALIGEVDRELSQTIASLRTWREGSFPIAQAEKQSPQSSPAMTSPKFTQPAPVAPASGPNAGSLPPLPFTPQAVQEVMKNQS
jgi:hypothetical protein